MKSVEKTGKTTDEAIEAALRELGVQRDDVEVDIIDFPSRGLFGLIGSKAAKVKVSLLEKKAASEMKTSEINNSEIKTSKINSSEIYTTERKPEMVPEKTRSLDKTGANDNTMTAIVSGDEEDPVAIAVSFLEKIFEKMGVTVHTDAARDGEFLHISFTGDDLGILIGRRGETLDSLQYLVNLVVARRMAQKTRIILDVEGYRKRREETLVKLAQRLSEKVKKTGHNIVLEPMSPHERRIIHTALQDDLKVRTFSEGEEPYRKVVITRKH